MLINVIILFNNRKKNILKIREMSGAHLWTFDTVNYLTGHPLFQITCIKPPYWCGGWWMKKWDFLERVALDHICSICPQHVLDPNDSIISTGLTSNLTTVNGRGKKQYA